MQTYNPAKYNALRAKIMDDPATHNWVKEIIERLETHDIVDVIVDLSVVSKLFNEKWAEIKRAHAI